MKHALNHAYPPVSPDIAISGEDLNDYLRRVQEAVAAGLITEAETKQKCRSKARDTGWTKKLREDCRAATFSAHDLARRVDNVSLSTLTRELKKLSALPPGALIRAARLAMAKRLLRSTRLLIRDVAAQSGYQHEKHFAAAFHRDTGISPSEYRRRSITKAKQE